MPFVWYRGNITYYTWENILDNPNVHRPLSRHHALALRNKAVGYGLINNHGERLSLNDDFFTQGINRWGHQIGETANYVPLIWFGAGQPIPLDDLIDPAQKIQYYRPVAINDQGQIIVIALPWGAVNPRSYLLTPYAD